MAKTNNRAATTKPTAATTSSDIAPTIPITTLPQTISQPFDTLATSGTANAWTDDSTLAGWYGQFALSNPTTYIADAGSNTTGALHSLGPASGTTTDRALAALPSNTTGDGFIALKLSNNSGSTITSLAVGYTGEQWRVNGAITNPQLLDFQYQIANAGVITDANTPTTGWVDFNALDFSSPITSGTTALDGNLAANKSTKSSTISVTVNAGQEVWLRWKDTNDSGNDHSLAVDDFSVTASGGGGGSPTNPSGVGTATPSTVVQGGSTLLTVAVTPGTNPTSTGLTVTGNLSTIGGSATQTFFDNGTNGDVTAGDNTFSYQATVAPATTTGVKSLAFTINDAQARTGTGSISLTVNSATPCTAADVTIGSVQGVNDTSAGNGTTVTVQGVVVGDYEGASPDTLRGFYLQDSGDSNAATSDGIFIFESDNANRVTVGQVVQVTGLVSEFSGQTQITSTTGIETCGSTGTVTPTSVTLPFSNASEAERYEGMLTTFPQTLTVTEPFYLGRFGAVAVSSGGRLYQPTNVTTPGASALALQAQNDLNRIIVDDDLQTQNPDPIKFGRGGNPLSASNTLRGGDTATGLTGVLTYTWSGNAASGNDYRLRPIGSLGGSPPNFQPANPRPPVNPAVGGTLKVAGANLLNYFNTFTGCTTGVGGASTSCRGANNATEFTRQSDKTVAALVGSGADVIGLSELENDGYGASSAIQDLVNKLNAATSPGTYAFINADAGTGQTNALGTDAIRNAIIYKPGKVTPVGTTAVLNSVAFVNGGDSSERNRPSLAQAFEENATTGRFILDVNHFKSKGSACDAPDAGDGQGNCATVRTNAANQLTSWLASNPTGTGDPDILIVGDLNSYALENPITAITGAGYINLISSHIGASAYSYVFDGQWGYLDHALSSSSLSSQVTGITEWHINADEPIVLDYNTEFKTAGQIASLYAPDAYRASDHDPVVVGLNLTGTVTPPVCPTNVAASSYGATATASSTINANHPASGAIDGNHKSWASGAGWNDATAGAYPDDLTINLGVAQQISEVDVYSLQDNYASPSEPSDAMTFNYYGLTSFEVQIPDGVGGWTTVPGGTITGNNLVRRRVVFGSPITTSQIRIKVNNTADGVYSRIVEVEAFSCSAVPAPTPTPTPTPCNTNVAAGSYGASATASSEAGPGYAASGAIDGNHTGAGWGTGVGWNDGTAGVFPDNLVINLGVTQALSEIDVYSLQDNYTSPIEPTGTTTFTAYGLTNFQVQIPDGMGGWLNVPGGNITGNNLVKRKVIFASPVMTSQIRILVTASADGVYSRVVEVEAFSCTAAPGPTPTPTPAPCNTNVAASSYGTSATASSEFNSGYPASGAIDGNHVGNPWGGGAGWNDGTPFVYPDTLTIDLVATQQLSEIDVYSLQDDYNNPVEPTDSMTFSLYGLVDFQVQIPNGLGGWVDVPGGHAVLNNLVKRKFIFANPITTNMIRIVVNNSSDAQFSRVVEVEAFSCTPVPTRCVNNGGTGGCFSTIQGAINAAPPNVPITVYPGTYDEDVNVNKAGIRLLGSGAGSTNIRGTMADATTSTVAVTASNVTIAGFTITRLGNNTTDWNNNLNLAGISIQGQAVTGTLIRDNVLTGNRTAIDINNSNGHTVRNNVIDFNRTGLVFRNQTDNETVVENFITNNWTVGILFLDGSGAGTPPQQALHSTFSNNNISANWYGQLVDRQSGGSLPAVGTTNLKNVRGNWLGTTSPVITTANSAEPGYTSQIPTAYGGSATAPGGQPDVAGTASANLKIDPILLSGTDTNVETTAGRGTFGFQGNPNTLVSPANQRNWAFFDDFGSGTGAGGFEAGPGTPPLGTGSAFLTVDSTARYAFEVFTHYAGTRMDDITALQYRSYQNNNANTVLAISLQFDIDYDLTDANNNFQGRLVFEPYMSGTVQQNTWQTWDARGAGVWYASKTDAGGSNGLCPQNAPCTWAQVLANFPNAGILNTPAGSVLFKAGGPWSPGFDGNVDAFKIGINSFRTTYDFEPVP